MVASAEKHATRAGVEILERGGNAVDAAVAVGLALAVTYPAAGNIGGGGFMIIRMADGRATAIDYREVAPRAATRDMYLGPDGKPIPTASLEGPRAAGAPGTVDGFALALQKYGRLKWREVVAPAHRLAEQGFEVSPDLAKGFRGALLAKFDESRRIYQRGGDYYRPGERFRQPALAATLSRLRDKGPREFYEGATARLIVEEMRRSGGLITADDLRDYRAKERAPHCGSYAGYELITMPPPSSGGVALLEMLNIWTALGGNSVNDSAMRAHLLIETMKRAFADRAEFLGDPDFGAIPVETLTSREYAHRWVATIDRERATPAERIMAGGKIVPESPQTTHYSVVDKDGNAVAVTYTLNFGFGSGVTVRGAGFLLNNEMDDFAAAPGQPNGFGLIQGERNAIAPRKRPLSSMTPAIVLKDGRVRYVLGSPGGPTIINTVLQVLLNLIDLDMGLEAAVAAPRIHHQWMPDSVSYERTVPPELLESLKKRGHKFEARPDSLGDVQAIAIDPKTGVRTGVSDPRSPDAMSAGTDVNSPVTKERKETLEGLVSDLKSAEKQERWDAFALTTRILRRFRNQDDWSPVERRAAIGEYYLYLLDLPAAERTLRDAIHPYLGEYPIDLDADEDDAAYVLARVIGCARRLSRGFEMVGSICKRLDWAWNVSRVSLYICLAIEAVWRAAALPDGKNEEALKEIIRGAFAPSGTEGNASFERDQRHHAQLEAKLILAGMRLRQSRNQEAERLFQELATDWEYDAGKLARSFLRQYKSSNRLPMITDVPNRGVAGRADTRSHSGLACSSLTTVRIPSAMLTPALSLSRQVDTGLPSVGSALSLPRSAIFQMHGRRMIGITRAVPASCRRIASCISKLKQ